jgi:hypothetical protein
LISSLLNKGKPELCSEFVRYADGSCDTESGAVSAFIVVLGVGVGALTVRFLPHVVQTMWQDRIDERAHPH